MIPFLIKLIGGSWIRAVIAGVVVLSIIAGGLAVYHAVYERGYNKAIAEYQKKKLREIERAVAAAREQWEASAEVAKQVLEKEKDISDATDDYYKKIPGVVAESPCNRVGTDVLRLFNDAVAPPDKRGDAGNSAGTAP